MYASLLQKIGQSLPYNMYSFGFKKKNTGFIQEDFTKEKYN